MDRGIKIENRNYLILDFDRAILFLLFGIRLFKGNIDLWFLRNRIVRIIRIIHETFAFSFEYYIYSNERNRRYNRSLKNGREYNTIFHVFMSFSSFFFVLIPN